MKKLIGLLVITALVMGSVAAQSLSMNYRTQATILNIADITADKPVLEFFNLHENNQAYESRARDDLTITFSGEKAGASVTIQPNIGNEGTNTIGIDAYYGWASFGPFKLTAGRFDSRYTNRVSGFAGNYNGRVGEYIKLGGLNGVKYIEDAANISVDGTATRQHALVGDLTIDKLLIKLAFLDAGAGGGGSDIVVNDAGTFVWPATNISLGYGLDIGTIEGVFRLPAKDVVAFGAYFRGNKLVENLDALAGFTMAIDNTNKNKMATEMGIDVRAAYTIDALLLATNMNFTKYSWDKWGIWIAGSGNYKINDTLTGRLTVAYINEWSNATTYTEAVNALLGLEIIAMRNSSISTGVELRYNLKEETARLMIPCILRVRL